MFDLKFSTTAIRQKSYEMAGKPHIIFLNVIFAQPILAAAYLGDIKKSEHITLKFQGTYRAAISDCLQKTPYRYKRATVSLVYGL